ncbi:aromatic di-alanine and TPR containing protein [Rhizoctonia solani 123E]|uniref:Aromatic di-alanine and TPR containing protein n=1 Tax=Rhizoctonia solani 123E TaxID=1423351 RepID=A0A074RJ04_9AGAM|nr:aromatic di-alanine and TPR containing protein [Rhizoctonia solani 123E]
MSNLGPKDLTDLSWSHLEQFERFGTLDDLEKANQGFYRALTLTPEIHPDYSHRLTDLGLSYTKLFQGLNKLEDLEKSIECITRALTITPDGHFDMPRRLSSLGISFTERFKRLGETGDLEKAIGYHLRAFALTPDGHRSMSRRLVDLGTSYNARFHHQGELTDLENSIKFTSRAIAITPNDHPDFSTMFATLGPLYVSRFQRLGELADLEKAIEYQSRAIALAPDGHPDIPGRLADLGGCCFFKFERLGELEALDKAIEYGCRALELIPDGNRDMSHVLTGLGECYLYRFRHLDELHDLEKSIDCKSRALALMPDNHTDMPDQLGDLGLSYNDRFRRLGKLADLEKSTEYRSRALALTPNGHPSIPHRLSELGMSYSDRFRHLDELEDLERSIEYASRALALTPDGHPNISSCMAGLGVGYSDRFERLGKYKDLEKSIKHHSRSLALTPDGHPNLSTRHFNYALSLLTQYLRTRNPSCLNTSLNSLRQASQMLTGAPCDKFQHALRWVKIASELIRSWNPMEAYQVAIDLLPQFIWLGATTHQRYQDLSLTKSLAVNACSAAIVSLDYSLALEWLEHARCVVWSQSLMLRSPLDQLHSSDPDLATQLERIAIQLQSSSYGNRAITTVTSESITPEKAGQERRRLAGQYNSMLTQAQQLPGFEDFLRPVRANKLLHVARNGPVVVLSCNKNQCDALLILPGHDDIHHLPLPGFTEEKAQRAYSELEASLRHKRLRERGVKLMHQPDYEYYIENVLKILWSNIVKPVLDYVGYLDIVPEKGLPHITWCPTGPLSFLPMHAAGDYSQPHSRIFDYAVSSYIPTLTALFASAPSSLNRNCRVLAVGQATTPGHNPLPGTIEELTHVKAHAHNKAGYLQLIDNQATIASVLDAMEQHDWVHLACHTHQNVNDPNKSGFYLHDSTLDLSAINQRSFKNKGLAFLSACQTATGNKKLPDEAIHLASGMLMAGYPSVIVMMWSVVTISAIILG